MRRSGWAVLLITGGLACDPARHAHAASCSISATAAAFGTYTPTTTTPTDSTATVSVSCSATVAVAVSYSLALSAGNSGDETSRALYSGSNTLRYQLYTDAARTQIWGDGNSGTSPVQNGYLLGALAPVTTTTTTYGRVPAQQNVAPGSYQDTVMLTITW